MLSLSMPGEMELCLIQIKSIFYRVPLKETEKRIKVKEEELTKREFTLTQQLDLETNQLMKDVEIVCILNNSLIINFQWA